ncbi:helix-turn-helix transcriptional regulator [Rhizobium sp.]|uniref:helix-turn-helix domain-containing protein n=1 Tax=Rhizobium sp. TaxID=391 RepID=UPI0028AEE435
MYIDRLQLTDAEDDTMGGRMSLARDAVKLSIEAAARNLGITPDIWASWENDRAAPAAGNLETIADTLEVSLAWLLRGHGAGPTWPVANDNAHRPS